MKMRRLVDMIGMRRHETRKPSLPEGLAVFAVGDIHGRSDLLVSIHQEIIRQIRDLPDATRKIIVYLGDYCDYGPQSADVIDLLVSTRLPSVTPVFLLGNHDLALIDFLKGKQDKNTMQEWLYRQGGMETVQSYGVGKLRDVTAIRHALLRKIPTDHLEFLEKLQLSYMCGDFFFVHAGIDPERSVTNQNPADLLAIGEKFLSSRHVMDKVIIHGHTPYAEPCIRPNRIGLDTGAHESGKLCALMLHGHKFHILETPVCA